MTGDDWLDTAEAKLLQTVLWSGHPDSRQDARVTPGELIRHRFSPGRRHAPARPREHLLTFEKDKQGEDWLSIIVFAELLYSVPLRVDRGGVPAWSWWFSPSMKGGR